MQILVWACACCVLCSIKSLEASAAPAVRSKESRTGHVGREAGAGQFTQCLEAILKTEFYSEWDGQLLESSEQRNDMNHLTFYEDPSGHWVEP